MVVFSRYSKSRIFGDMLDLVGDGGDLCLQFFGGIRPTTDTAYPAGALAAIVAIPCPVVDWESITSATISGLTGTASVAGTATWFRLIRDGAINTSTDSRFIEGTVGAVGSGADIEVSTTVWLVDTAFTVSDIVISVQ